MTISQDLLAERSDWSVEWDFESKEHEVTPVPAGSRPPIRSTAALRDAWREYRCATKRMVSARLFGKWNTPVNPKTVDAWRALETTLGAAGYDVHRAWVYVCRNIAGQKAASLHAYGLAIDIDHSGPRCNVNIPTPDRRKVRFSTAATKLERCRDVQLGKADTAFTAEQVAAVEAIRTVDGHQVFAWGGRWPTTKDTMHFQINVTPQELARGIAEETVRTRATESEWGQWGEAPETTGDTQSATSELITFTAKTLPIRVSVLATTAARAASEVEVVLFAHGLDVCGPIAKPRPQTFITQQPFKLGALAEASGRPIVLVVPFLDWENLSKNKLAFGRKWHRLGQPENLNSVVGEALESVGAPTMKRLILAGHSRAFGVFDALAAAHANPAMRSGALARLSHVWALDSTYTSPVTDWVAWLRSRSDLQITVVYRFGKHLSKETHKEVRLSTGVHGERFRAQVSNGDGRLTVIPLPAGKLGHCAVPGKYLPELLLSLPEAPPRIRTETADADASADVFESSVEAFGAFADQEDEQHEVDVSYGLDYEGQQDQVLESSGLTLAEIKAVQITSTFETGKRGGFYGLSGNFDGYGVSFGLVNWNIGTGSLQPLLRDFAAAEPARWKAIFGPDATKFCAVMTPRGKNAVRDQLRFAIEVMNTSRVVNGRTNWSVKEPWVTRFKELAEDKAFQRIQVRYVRALLDRARQFCEQFGLKSEMSFAFMFDTVSSHGPWWLTKKWKNGIQKRRVLLLPRLTELSAKYGKGNIPEKEVLLAVAKVLAETSSQRWRANVSRRKRWFVTGEHSRALELQGLKPRPNVPYQSSTKVSAGSAPHTEREAAPAASHISKATVRAHMSKAERAGLIAAASKQATTAGTEADRRDIADTLKANGTDVKTWFAQMVPDATFLGHPIRESGGDVPGVHRALLQALQRAERALVNAHPGRTPEQLGKEMGIYSIAGLRPPKKATGAQLASYHCFGLAIDINHPTNPFVGNNRPKKPKEPVTQSAQLRYAEFSANRSPCIIERAMWLLRSERFNPEKKLTVKNAGAAWDIHHRASETFADYLQLADDLESPRLPELVAKAHTHGDKRDLETWKRRIASDRAVIKNWDFQHVKHPEKTGYMDLPRELVVALTDAGLLWGGLYRTAKDIMHFDLRDGPIRRRGK